VAAAIECEVMLADDEGWSEWIHPVGNEQYGYLMQCCDCNLIHEMEFAIVPANKTSTPFNEGETKRGLIVFRARRFDANPNG